MALKTMSISKLMELKQKVDAVLVAKVAEERRALQSRLTNLVRVGSGCSPGRRGRRPGQGGAKVPQSGKSLGNLGGPRIEAAVAGNGTEVRQEA